MMTELETHLPHLKKMYKEDAEASKGFAPLEFFYKEELLCCYAKDGVLDPKSHHMPSLGALFQSDLFATLLMGYNDLGLYFIFTVDSPKITVSYPDIEKGDSIQLYIDTRCVSQAKTTHRFCHHFFFLPEAFDGISCGEITRFRTEDTHTLCAAEELELVVKKKRAGYVATIHIPAHCLAGYSPHECSKIGFTYKICRSDGACQYFSLTNKVARIEYAPYLWATLGLQDKMISK